MCVRRARAASGVSAAGKWKEGVVEPSFGRFGRPKHRQIDRQTDKYGDDQRRSICRQRAEGRETRKHKAECFNPEPG